MGRLSPDLRAAREARQVYQLYRDHLDTVRGRLKGRRYCVPRQWFVEGDPDATPGVPSVWLRLVRVCRRHGVDPLRYVIWCLTRVEVMLDPAPEPNELLRSDTIRAYLNWLPSVQDGLRDELSLQKNLARRHIGSLLAVGRKDATACVLTDPVIPLSPLFRFCVAYSIGGEEFLKIAERSIGAAILQYERCPDEYDAAWGHIIPAGFRAAAAEAYPNLISDEPENSMEHAP